MASVASGARLNEEHELIGVDKAVSAQVPAEPVSLSVTIGLDGVIEVVGPLHNKKLCNWLVQHIRAAVRNAKPMVQQ